MGSIIDEKSRLRRELLARRKALPNRAEKNAMIARAVSEFPPYREAERLLFYVNLKTEPETEHLLREAWKQGRETYAPKCLPGGRLRFYRVTCREDLHPGSFGILEPKEDCPVLEQTGDRDLCLVPGLAFDREGYRLGYGKGYYDRFLAEHRVSSLGLCYEALVVPRLPREEHDRSIDWVVTEAGLA